MVHCNEYLINAYSGHFIAFSVKRNVYINDFEPQCYDILCDYPILSLDFGLRSGNSVGFNSRSVKMCSPQVHETYTRQVATHVPSVSHRVV